VSSPSTILFQEICGSQNGLSVMATAAFADLEGKFSRYMDRG
jgi:hypothetical protein